jgi:cell division protein FtsQ
MAAVVRGGASSSRTAPRSKAPAQRPSAPKRAPPSQATGRDAGYRPAKLHAASRVGLNPRIAVAVAVGVVALGLIVALATGSRPHAVKSVADTGLANRLAALGFKTQAVHVQGAPAAAQADILRAASLYKGQPILGVDLEALRQRVEAVGWVKQAKIIRLLPDTLVIAVVPREILAVWQYQGVVHVIDPDGKVIPEADPSRFADLPLVVGDGAGEAAGAILPLLRQRPRLMSRIEALVRVDGRRWDIRLKDGGIIQLPAVGEDSALIQLDQLDQKAQVIELGFERIDLRDSDLVAVRPRTTTTGSPGGVTPRP